MSDLSITVGNCLNSDAATETRIAAESITQGQALYAASSTTVGLADNNAAGKTVCVGIALNPATAGQPVTYAKGTDGSYGITLGATMTAGLDYYLSANAGGICPVGDLSSGMAKFHIGFASSTTVLKMQLKSYGVTL